MNGFFAGLIIVFFPATFVSVNSDKRNELAEKLHGLWISEDYLAHVESNRSVYDYQFSFSELLGFQLDKANLLTKGAVLSGFTVHEGGIEVPMTYDQQKSKFVSDATKDNHTFRDAFELNYMDRTHAELSFPESKSSKLYRKVDDFDTELRKILTAGQYKTSDNSFISFGDDGTVRNFNDYKYHEVIYDFGLGIEYDAVVFFKTSNGGNWSDGEIYRYEIASNELRLKQVKTDWETMDHIISDETIVLRRF